MTNKFKIGDRVRLLPFRSGYAYGHEGETAVVIEDGSIIPDIQLDKPCTIHGEGECEANCWNQDFLELAEPEVAKEMTTWQDRLDGLLKEYRDDDGYYFVEDLHRLEQDLVTFTEEVYAEGLEAVAEAYKAGFIKGSLENKQAEADIDSTNPLAQLRA